MNTASHPPAPTQPGPPRVPELSGFEFPAVASQVAAAGPDFPARAVAFLNQVAALKEALPEVAEAIGELATAIRRELTDDASSHHSRVVKAMEHGATTVAEIAADTNLKRPRVEECIADLMNVGRVEAREYRGGRHRSGRAGTTPTFALSNAPAFTRMFDTIGAAPGGHVDELG